MGERAALSEIATENGLIGGPFGSNLVSSDYRESGVPVIRGANMSGRSIGGDFVFVSEQKFEQDLSRNVARPGDLVFTQRGTLGQVSVVPEAPYPRYVVSQSQMRMRVDTSKADPQFVYLACSSEDFRKQVLNHAISTGVPHINLAILGGLRISLPSLSEQRAIAEVLGALDDKIAANDRVHMLAKQLLASRFEALTIDVDPSNGASVTVEDLMQLNPSTPAPTTDEPVYLEMKNLPDREVTVRSWSHRPAKGGLRFTNGDTLLARITPCLENGKTGFVDFMQPGEIGIGSTEYIVMRSQNGLPKMLSYFLAISPRFRDFAIKHMTGTSGRQRLSSNDLKDLRLGAPDADSLAKFGELSETLHAAIKADMESSRQLAKTRDELLPLLMSGKIRVRDAEKVVSDVV